MTADVRGMRELIVVGLGLTALGASVVWRSRRALRRRHVVVPAVVLLLAIPPAITMVRDIRSHAGGEAAAWGWLAELVIVMGLTPVLCIAGGALVAGLIALAMYGLATPNTLATVSRAPWYTSLVRPRSREESVTRLYLSMGSMIVVAVLWLLGLRPGG